MRPREDGRRLSMSTHLTGPPGPPSLISRENLRPRDVRILMVVASRTPVPLEQQLRVGKMPQRPATAADVFRSSPGYSSRVVVLRRALLRW
jgi:hypothetical protein